MSDNNSPTCVGVRQKEFDFEEATKRRAAQEAMRPDPNSGIHQREFDFNYSTRHRIIENLVLPKSLELPRGLRAKRKQPDTVSGSACRRVLRALLTFAQKQPTAIVKRETIAKRACLSVPVVARAISALVSLYLLDLERRSSQRGSLASEYRIVWSNLLDYLPEGEREKVLPATADQGIAKYRGELAKYRDEFAKARSDTPITTKRNHKKEKIKKPPPTPSNPGKSGSGEGGILKSESVKAKAGLRGVLPKDLTDEDRFGRLFAKAVQLGLVGESDRERREFYALREHALRIGTNPPALFASNVNNGNWKTFSEEDNERARKVLLERDRFLAARERPELVRTVASGLFNAPECPTAQARDEAIRRLKTTFPTPCHGENPP